MCKGISISKARFRQELIEEFDLAQRLTTDIDSSQLEWQFMYTDPVVQLPVLRDGELLIYEWATEAQGIEATAHRLVPREF